MRTSSTITARRVKRPDAGGYLVISKPWPSMLRTIWRDNERYIETYWEKFDNRFYVAGDSAHRDKDGYFWIMGRIDDVLNVSGHRLGTMEIESALVAHPRVAEAAVVGKPHDDQGRVGVRLRRAARARARRATPVRSSRSCATGWAEQLGADRQARRHPLRRQPAEDALGQDHAAAAASRGARRGDHPGRLDAGESGDPRSAARHRAGPSPGRAAKPRHEDGGQGQCNPARRSEGREGEAQGADGVRPAPRAGRRARKPKKAAVRKKSAARRRRGAQALSRAQPRSGTPPAPGRR